MQACDPGDATQRPHSQLCPTAAALVHQSPALDEQVRAYAQQQDEQADHPRPSDGQLP